MSALVRGTLILTLATVISKVLGFIYVVPFTALVGTQGYILFEYAYKPYVIVLSLATLGIPLAVSKFVSKYNELGDYVTGQRLFKSGLLFLTMTGFTCFLLLFFSAPSIAALLVDPNDPTGNSAADIIFVIRMVSFALIVVPPMAVARGFFQGYQSMGPTAISQVTDQLIRILFILVGAFLVVRVFDKSASFAVGLATFAAFVGALGGSLILFWYWLKVKDSLLDQAAQSRVKSSTSLASMYKELISYAVPFVIAGLAIPLYQTIDTFTINQAMMSTGVNQLQAETVNSVVALVQKIIMIPVSLATALGLTLVPTITKSYVANDMELLRSQISKTFLIIFFFTFPSVSLLMALANPSYSFLFGTEHAAIGGQLMLWYAPSAIILSLFLVTTAILQGLDRHRFVLLSLGAGLLVKVATNHVFVVQFGGIGSVLSTSVGFLISIAFNHWAIKAYSGFRFHTVRVPILKSLLLTVITGIVVWLVDDLIKGVLSSLWTHHYLLTGSRLLVGGLVGSCLYLYFSVKLGVMQKALGEDMIQKMTGKLARNRNRRSIH